MTALLAVRDRRKDMYCGNCGMMLPYGAPSCPNCGMAAGYGTNYCRNCGMALNHGSSYCSACGSNVGGNISVGGKSRLVAGLLGIFLGGLGIHNFYLGYTRRGVAQILLSVFTAGLGSLWGFIEGVLILIGNYRQTDANGRYLDS